MTDAKGHSNEPEMKGWLFKWTNYLKGYQRRWFVLQNGTLSYYRLKRLKKAEPSSSSGPTNRLSMRRRRRLSRAATVDVENQAEMVHTCRGTISLHGAIIHTEDSCTFVISNGSTQTFHIKAANEVERQRWVTTLELAKAKAIRAMESEEEEEFESNNAVSEKEELQTVLKTLTSRLEDMQTCSDLMAKHGAALQRALSELETSEGSEAAAAAGSKLKAIGEKATLFRIASNAMINTCSEYLDTAQAQGKRWQRLLQHEREQRQQLEEMVETLARQHSSLEQAAKEANSNRPPATNTAGSQNQTANAVSNQTPGRNPNLSPSDEDEENEFYDAMEDTVQPNFILKIPLGHRRPSSAGSQNSEGHGVGGDNHDEGSGSSSEVDEAAETTVCVITSDKSNTSASAGGQGHQSGLKGSGDEVIDSAPSTPTSLVQKMGSHTPKRIRRTRVPEKPNYPLNLWSIMKNCIGKELTKIPMPVNFSEPLSMLQRLAEDYEYADILHKAAKCSDSCEQLAMVAAFTVSSYATTSCRTGKPFNPLLGETYECDRTADLGWRTVCEQVSHHPPMVAQYGEGLGWRCWQEFTMASKFRGKYLQVVPLGTAHLEFLSSGNHYTWRKVTTTVHNIIVGKLWVDQHGDMDIVNHKTGDKCHLKYIPYSYFTRDVQRKVKGCVMDKNGSVKWVVQGTWDNKIEIAEVISSQGNSENPVFKTGPYKVAWKRRPLKPDAEKYYNFTELACQLNEPEEGVAPTDSRLRPDQRLMEDGQWDEANSVKLRLEEKQRGVRRQREAEAEKATAEGRPYPPYEPIWFKQETEKVTGVVGYMYQGKYWECKEKQDWSKCPNIY
ncbi:oxysterol-binding protein 1-like isoform X2 [Neocloeon triangulifer]|uniref:oxysterol-binding protein 1-like isoform X2 n=1 Tax=Neocloeon triangulifer TaxID=2078957 RepID=UPI00286EDA8F|nr:oxysterol-binding protein 1-like isoform X2 [Neocloeon triangulifer]